MTYKLLSVASQILHYSTLPTNYDINISLHSRGLSSLIHSIYKHLISNPLSSSYSRITSSYSLYYISYISYHKSFYE